MKTNTNIKPVASLSSSLLARKGEAMPAVAATIYNNPGLAWGDHQHGHQHGDEKAIHQTKRMDTSTAPKVLAPRNQTMAQTKAQTKVTNNSLVKKYLKRFPHKQNNSTSAVGENILKKESAKQKGDSIALIFNIEDKNYMRLKYQAQVSGKTSKELIRNAIERYLDEEGTPNGSGWSIKPSE